MSGWRRGDRIIHKGNGKEYAFCEFEMFRSYAGGPYTRDQAGEGHLRVVYQAINPKNGQQWQARRYGSAYEFEKVQP